LNVIDPRQATLVAPGFLDLLDSAQFTFGGTARFGGREAGRDMGFRGKLEM
jgi:hypothetical protein